MEINVRCDKLPQPLNLVLEASSTVGQLLDQVCGRVEVNPEFKGALVVKQGFPPRPAQLVHTQTLAEAGFQQREKLIVSVDDEMLEKLKAEKNADMDPLEIERQKLLEEKRAMMPDNVGCDPAQATAMQKEFVKADGNCLFNCASLAMEGTVEKPAEMRQITASIMMSNPDKYSREELGKDPQAYVEWLTSGPSSWGGIPELKALGDFYGVEMGVVVIHDMELLMFNHRRGFAERIYVLFDGTHYNLIVHKRANGEIVRRFGPQDEQAYQGCLELARVCKSKNEDIDPAIFSLVCYECSKGLIGQVDAVQHAQETGHTDFRQTAPHK